MNKHCYNPILLGKLLIVLLVLIPVLEVKSQQIPDENLERKYDLKVLPEHNEIDPAPVWLQKADMFTGGSGGSSREGALWGGYQFLLKDTLVRRIVRDRAGYSPQNVIEQYPIEIVNRFNGNDLKGVSLISHVPHNKKGFQLAHEQGFKVIPYVHFMDIHDNYADQDVFMFNHPEILLKDVAGKWVHTPMDGSDRAFRFLICANSPSYWKLSLAYVKKMMDWGADGIFIDNVGKRFPCLGPRFQTKNPEFAPYVHEHLFPDATQDYAFDRLLQAIRALVKSYGHDKIVIVNSGIGTRFQKDGDCSMWESFIYSWAWKGRKHTWEEVKKRAEDNAWYLKAGRRIVALSTINPSSGSAKEDAFWAFSAARLVDFIWWAGLRKTGAEVLYQAHMGNGIGPFVEISDGIVYRIYQNGFIVLNNSLDNKTIDLPLHDIEIKHDFIMDIFNKGKKINLNKQKGTFEVSIPRQSARVFLYNMMD